MTDEEQVGGAMADYAAYRHAVRDRQFQEELRAETGDTSVQGAPWMPMETQGEKLRPPENPLTPGKAVPALIKAGPQAASGVVKGIAEIPHQVATAVDDLTDWITNAPGTHHLGDFYFGPTESDNPVERHTRAVVNFAATFFLAGGLGGVALKALGLTAKAPALAAASRTIAAEAMTGFTVGTPERGGSFTQSAATMAAERLPEAVKGALTTLIAEDPNDAAAVTRFKTALGTVVDFKAIPALVSVAKLMWAAKAGAAGRKAAEATVSRATPVEVPKMEGYRSLTPSEPTMAGEPGPPSSVEVKQSSSLVSERTPVKKGMTASGGKDFLGSGGKGFAEERYSTEIGVRLTWSDGTTYVDAIKGLNEGHALARAKSNWPDAVKVEKIPLKDVVE